jgi:hypothetical protein
VNFIAAWLSTCMVVGPCGGIPSSVRSSCIQRHSQVALLTAIYSASMVDSATVGCFFEYQDMAANPEMDFQSIGLIPQLASE